MKYLFVSGADFDEFAKAEFEEKFKGDLTELWGKVWDSPHHRMGYSINDSDETIGFELRADNLDEYTFNVMSNLVDYLQDECYGWIKAE